MKSRLAILLGWRSHGDNGKAWSQHKRKLSGFDFVFSPDKSVSLALEFAPTPAESAPSERRPSIA